MLRHCQGKNHLQGFSLIELLVVLLISSLVISSAAGYVGSLLQNNRADNAAETLAGLLNRARIYALEFGEEVVVCGMNIKPIVQGGESDCSNDWTQGAVVFIDRNREETDDRELSANDQLLEVRDVMNDAEGSQILKNQSSFFSYRTNGLLSELNASVFYCPRGDTQFRRSITLNGVGRTRIEKGVEVTALPKGC